ncbi:hypothetical protein D3C80_2201720 [compost metagenome]
MDEDHDLAEAGLLETRAKSGKTETYTKTKWGWDDIAKIFHTGSKHNFPSDLSQPSEHPEKGYVEFLRKYS